ncbi:hypothetical protein CEXT_171601 [Caerostris extrusa]|uniref:Uncharacterized protein n=1 Tax=Caerostris extrusa TaxID=172846 RepID=A0AAV4S164_CAEEX|nr:hypothetical protein CEXT_171601 [Caerostris extrusa]
MLLATAWPAYYRMCAQQTVYCSNKPAAVAPRNHHIISSFVFLELGEKKAAKLQGKFVAAQKMLLLKQKPANIRKWIARFCRTGIYIRWKLIIAHNNCGVAISIWSSSIYLIRIRSITDRTNQATVFSNQICS